MNISSTQRKNYIGFKLKYLNKYWNAIFITSVISRRLMQNTIIFLPRLKECCIGVMILFYESVFTLFIKNKDIFENGLYMCPMALGKEFATRTKQLI